jgi:probable F420-dependent oxidoreductase
MDFGIQYFPVHDGIAPAALARRVEERGHESLFFTEHTHIPAARESPYPGGGPLPAKYWHCYDLFVACAAAATVTSKLRIGTAICLVVQHDPIVTANAVASIDHLSGGRFVFGVGAGWNREEMRNHGTDPRTRFTLMRERVEAMKAIWTQTEATYVGEHVRFERILSFPKPAQRPHPPILIGGDGPTVLDRVRSFGDAWFPNMRTPQHLERIEALARDGDESVEVHLAGVPADPAILERVRNAGVRRAVHLLPSGAWSQIEPRLAAWEAAIAQCNGE